jgi:hypothetical protein
MQTRQNGLREFVEQFSVGKTAANHVNWRVTTGFVFLIWGDLSWQLYLPFVISLRHRLLNWQPIALKRTIDDLVRNYRAFCACVSDRGPNVVSEGATWCAATRKLVTPTTYGSEYKVTLFIRMTPDSC